MAEIPKNLFEYGENKEDRNYKFQGVDGKEHSVILNQGDILHPNKKCPTDGVNLIIYSGYPHNVIECPCCHESFSDAYTPKVFLKNSKRTLSKLESKILFLKNIIEVGENPNHSVRKANLENSVYKK